MEDGPKKWGGQMIVRPPLSKKWGGPSPPSPTLVTPMDNGDHLFVWDFSKTVNFGPYLVWPTLRIYRRHIILLRQYLSGLNCMSSIGNSPTIGQNTRITEIPPHVGNRPVTGWGGVVCTYW